MKRRIHDALLGIVGLAGVAFFALSGASCEKPTMQCAVGHGPFIVKYAVTSGDAACYPGGTAEEIGFSTYLQSKTKTNTGVTYDVDDDKDPATPAANDDADPSTPDVAKQYTVVESAGADYNTRKIAVQSTTFGNLLQGRAGAGLRDTGAAYMFGTYTSNPDNNNLCYAFGNGETTDNVAELEADAFDTGEVDDMMMPIIEPAFHYRQEWKNIRFYVTEGVPGTQTVGEMTFDNLTPGEECSVTFKFVGLYPAVHCMADILVDSHDNDDPDPDPNDMITFPDLPDDNDDADPMNPDVPTAKPVGDPVPDDALCNPVAEVGWKKPPMGTEYRAPRVFGSGINPDFKTKCDVDLGYCVLNETPLTGDP